MTLILWTRGKPFIWVVTVPEKYTASHQLIWMAAKKAAVNKSTKYFALAAMHSFVPVAIKTSGVWCSQFVQFIEDLGRLITAITNEPIETTYLYQRMSVTLQKGNEVAFHNTFPEP